jgi:hypothetical protein
MVINESWFADASRRVLNASHTLSRVVPVSITLAMGTIGCSQSAPLAAERATESDVSATKAPIVNGFTGIDGDYSGIVRIWATNAQFNEFRQFCSGVLLTNDVVLTAAHCVRLPQQALDYGWPDTRDNTDQLTVSTDQDGFNAQGVGAPVYAPDGRDLALFRISTKLPVASGDQILSDGYFHKLGGTPMPDATLAVIGYGPTTYGVTSTICNYVSEKSGERIPGCNDDQFVLSWGTGTYNSNGSEIVADGLTAMGGDSGGPMVILAEGGNIADLGLVGITSLASRCAPAGSGNCGTAAARLDDLGTWLRALVQ